MITSTRQVRVTVSDKEWTVELASDGGTTWQVTLPSGRQVGEVEKTSYTYSPPTHRGSRVARYHHEVPAWRSRIGGYDTWRGLAVKTRKQALIELLAEHFRREAVMKKVVEYCWEHRDATFQLNRPSGVLVGKVVSQQGSLFLRRRPEGDERIHIREIDSDQRPCLEVKHDGNYDAMANVLYELHGDIR